MENKGKVKHHLSTKNIVTSILIIIGVLGGSYGGVKTFNGSIINNNVEVSKKVVEDMNLELEKINNNQEEIIFVVQNLTDEIDYYKEELRNQDEEISDLKAKISSLETFKELFLHFDSK